MELLKLSSCTFTSMQIFEWWYFKKYGISFIEQVSLSHLSPLLGRSDCSSDGGGDGNSISNGIIPHSVAGNVGIFFEWVLWSKPRLKRGKLGYDMAKSLQLTIEE
jgi:ST7 protein